MRLSSVVRVAKVGQLLHDAEHAEAGAEMAIRMRDKVRATNFYRTARKLRSEAIALDPNCEAPAWAEDDALSNRLRGGRPQ
jgi:hypothetical protein